ncbi:MAG: DUF554 domain-containing protein [Spirochaetaceae bacterium]|jgi:uncharacterized membrane protein YqgA involved in biofilm formation|nr:DUF554 domain-containing protein [Spirochaetaceae bacterium]
MLGPAINALAIVLASLAGSFLIRGIPDRFEGILKQAIGLAIIFIGIKGALENQDPLLLIMSLVLGAIIGEAANIDKCIHRLGDFVERSLILRMGAKSGISSRISGEKDHPDGLIPYNTQKSFSKGFVQASILFCSGSMAIVGSMQSGFYGNHEVLFAKTILDASISIVFGAAFGIGTAFSAIPVFLYQGGIALISMQLGALLSPEMIREMSAVGNLVVAAIGFNFLGIKEIKVANLIPAIVLPLLYLSVKGMFFS